MAVHEGETEFVGCEEAGEHVGEAARADLDTMAQPETLEERACLVGERRSALDRVQESPAVELERRSLIRSRDAQAGAELETHVRSDLADQREEQSSCSWRLARDSADVSDPPLGDEPASHLVGAAVVATRARPVVGELHFSVDPLERAPLCLDALDEG